jgi:hypothetical protein
LRFASLRQNAAIEALFARLAAGDWITRHENQIIVGKTGSEKVGWPVHLATRPAAMIAPSSATAYRGCSMRSCLHGVTVGTRASLRPSRASSS